jgi:amidase
VAVQQTGTTDGAWATASARELAGALRRREVSSRELLELYLDRIDRLDGPIGAVVTLDAEGARRRCAEADEALVRGRPLGPLHGLPVTVKDAIATGGLRSTGGATELRDHVPAEDAPAVARLRAAGAVVFGKTNLPRWSGDLQTYNEMFGTTSNPWDTARTAGGSSGGPAAAVACGFTAFELGTDIGGSVRVPSHFCGAFGLKPSFGVVPQRGYLDHVGGGTTDADINVFGPIARSAADLELLLDVLAGPEPERAGAWRLTLPPPACEAVRGARVAVWFDDPALPVDSEYRAVLGRLADRLSDAGAGVEEARPPVDARGQVDLFFSMLTAALSPSSPDDQADAVGGSHRRWLAREERRAALRAQWAEWFTGWDVLLCPVTPTAAFPHDQGGGVLDRTMTVDGESRPYVENLVWTGLIGIMGLPSAVPPIGRTASGLPVGVQVVAPYLRDRTAVRLAGVVADEADVPGGYEPPPGFGPG